MLEQHSSLTWTDWRLKVLHSHSLLCLVYTHKVRVYHDYCKLLPTLINRYDGFWVPWEYVDAWRWIANHDGTWWLPPAYRTYGLFV